MKRTLAAALVLLSSCSPKPCDEWKGWEFPRLEKISTCEDGRISLRLAGEPQTLWAMFEKRGYERGYSEAKLIINDDSTVFAKEGEAYAYKIQNEGDQLTITKPVAEQLRFISAAELARVDAFPQALAKWHASLKGVSAAFDSKDKGEACDRALLSEAIKPPTPDSKVAFLLNLDQLDSGAETRVGVPTLLKVHERTAPSWLREAAAQYEVLQKRKALIAFRVAKYVEPRFVTNKFEQAADGKVIERYSPGVVVLDLALIELGTPRVVCRTTLSARSSSSLNPDANFDLDLKMNVGLAAQSAFSFR